MDMLNLYKINGEKYVAAADMITAINKYQGQGDEEKKVGGPFFDYDVRKIEFIDEVFI